MTVMNTGTVIQYGGVSKKYKLWPRGKTVQALEDFSLAIEEGEVFGFLGPNGAGKSTAIKILLNLIFPNSGFVSLLGRDASDPHVRKAVGYLPENPYFYDHLSAEELLMFGGRTSGLGKKEITARTDELLHLVDLSGVRKRPLRTYSKGMVQRAGLALALIHDPQVVVLDEPMSGLDPIGRKMVSDIILNLKVRGKTVFFSSHILTDIERFCDRAGFLIRGRLRLVERLDRLMSGGDTLENVFLNEVKKAGGGAEA